MTEEKPDSPFTKLCKDLEHFETPQWAAEEILRHEILTDTVLDPCAGSFILTRAAGNAGYHVNAWDIHSWSKTHMLDVQGDYLTHENAGGWAKGNTVLMNPPFSLAEQFVEKSLEYGARKILCFQRFSWYEGEMDSGRKRGQFWERHPPNRIYICGSRATCWRHDVPPEERVNAKGREKTTPTSHAWFVWEKGQPAGTLTGHIYNPEKSKG